MKLSQTLFAISTTPVLLMTLVLGALLLQFQSADQHRRREEAARTALDHSLQLVHSMARCGFSVYRYAADLDPSDLDEYRRVKDSIPDTLNEIEAVCESNESRAAAKRIAEELGKIFAISEEIIWSAPLQAGDSRPIRTNELRTALHPEMYKLSQLDEALSATLLGDEATTRPQDEKNREQLFVALGLIAAVAGSAALVAFFNKGILSRIDVLIENTMRYPRGLELKEPLKGSDEIADLDRTFHQMVASLDEARRRERSAIADSADIIAVLDSRGVIKEINTHSEWIGKSFEGLLQNGEVQIDDCDYLVSVVKSSLDERFFCILHDITERKALERLIAESAERETLIFESIPTPVLVLESSGKIVRSNAAARQFLERLGNPEVLFPDELKNAGMPIDVSIDNLPSGQLLAVLLDLSERRALENSKKQLLQTIATEIDAPLERIRATLKPDIGELNEAGKVKVENAGNESDRLIRLFKDLLRVEQEGDLRISRAQCNLSETARAAATAIQPQADKAQCRLTVEAPNAVTASVDRERMIQVLINLLSNAIKFSSPDETICVRVKDDGAAAVIEVADEGPGIPQSVLPTIFDAFVQARKSDATEKGGSGLGLAICKTVIEAHGGQITVDNNPARGCTFRITLPV